MENPQDTVGILAWVLVNHPDATVTGAPDAYSNSASQVALIIFLESIPRRLLSYD